MSSSRRMVMSAIAPSGASACSLFIFYRWLTDAGNDRWEQDIIDEDNRMYNRRAAESNARTQEEIDAAVLTSHPDGAATAVGQDDDDDEDGMAHEDWEVHLSGLGDLAALAAGPVARSEV